MRGEGRELLCEGGGVLLGSPIPHPISVEKKYAILYFPFSYLALGECLWCKCFLTEVNFC